MNIRCVKDTAIEFKRPDNPYSVDEEVEKIVKTILETPVEPLEFPNNHPDAQWLPKSLGLFMHWGIHSVDGAQPSWTMLKNSPWGMSDSLRGDDYYSVLAPKFNPVNYDPDKWCAAAKKAGFDYMVLTTKHHDGYALWPSKYGSMNTRVYMNGRDLIKEYVDACRKNGLRVGFYFSPRDWHYPNCPMRKFNYNFIDYIDYEVNEWIFPYSSRIEAEIYWKEFYKYTIGQLNELLTQYGKIDMLWFDGQEAIVDDYKFDETINWIRSLQPGILINDRWYLAANGCKADFSTAEGRYPKTKPQGLWEFCNHGAKHWGYCKEDPIGTFENFINYYEKTMKDNGAYLFNVGPAPDGTMPPEYYDFCIQLEEYFSK
jgi:alpha-L-fucosidase